MKKYIFTILVMLGFGVTGFTQKSINNQRVLKSIPYEKNIVQSSSKEEIILTYLDPGYIPLLGFGEDVPIRATVLAYFPEEIISPHVGDTIQAISVGVDDSYEGDLYSLKVCIWKDTTNACAHPVYEQEVDLSSFSIFNDGIILDQPYVLEEEGVFIGYKVVGKGYILFAENGTSSLNENGYGDMFMEPDGQLKHAGDYGYGDFYIKAIIGRKDPVDIMLKEIIPNSFAVLGDNEVFGVVQNKGANPITSYDVTYTIDGGDLSSVYHVTDVNIAPRNSAIFTHDIPAYFTTIGNHTIEVEISNVNGGGETDLDNNKIRADIQVMNEVFPQNVVYEEVTGTWCGWCPRGIVGLNTMEHEITDGSWIGVAIHKNDPMEMMSHEYFDELGLSSFPDGKMNRKQNISPAPNSLPLAYRQHKNVMPPAKIEVTSQTWNSETRDFTVDVGVNFILDMTSVDYGLSLIVVEDSIRGSGGDYAQRNNYSNNIDLIDWDGTNWKNLPNPVPASQMVYNHVARQLIGGFDGVSGIIPESVNYGTAYSYTFSGNIPESHNELHTHFVALIIDNTDGHIVNATKVKLGNYDGMVEHEKENRLNVYPNPSTGVITIEDVEDTDITVYDMLGKVVYTKHCATQKTEMDLSYLQSGNYIVRVIDKDKFSTQKMIFIE